MQKRSELEVIVRTATTSDVPVGFGMPLSMKSTPFSRYAASKEGVAIINAMTKISSLAVRRQVINLIESLSASTKQ